MPVKDYYGNNEARTVLQIHAEIKETDTFVIHRKLYDQEAYDTWHLSLYFKEILAYKNLQQQENIEFGELPRPEKSVLLYLLLATNPHIRSIVELGSSLMEIIDGLETVNQYIAQEDSPLQPFDVKELTFYGIEMSTMFRQAANYLHPGYKIKSVPKVTDYQEKAQMAYDRVVASFAFESADELAEFVNAHDIVLINAFFSLSETFASISVVGKSTTYFSLSEFLSKCDGQFYHLFGQRVPTRDEDYDVHKGHDVVEGFFLFDKSGKAVEKMLDLVSQSQDMQQYFEQKSINPRLASYLLEAK